MRSGFTGFTTSCSLASRLIAMRRRARRRAALGVLAGAVGASLLLAGPAAAHVTVQPPTATAGGYATLSFKVPTESDTASTTGLDVQFPVDTPIASVSVQPKPGWTYEVTKAAPAEPLTVHGSQVSEVVTRVIWTARNDGGIRPGEFDTFTVSAGPLPEDADQLVFKTLQTYSDGEVVRWIDVAADGGEEPADPAPILALTPAESDGHGAQATDRIDPGAETVAPAVADGDRPSSDATARALGIAGLAVGLLGLAAGVVGLTAARRRT